MIRNVLEAAAYGAARGVLWGGGIGVAVGVLGELIWAEADFVGVGAIAYGMAGVVLGAVVGAVAGPVAWIRQERRRPQ